MINRGDGLASLSWLDWKLGARLLLKYPALTIIGGLSLAGAIAIGAVGIELADELLYKRLPFDEGSRVVRLETQDTAASRVEPRLLHEFAITIELRQFASGAFVGTLKATATITVNNAATQFTSDEYRFEFFDSDGNSTGFSGIGQATGIRISP